MEINLQSILPIKNTATAIYVLSSSTKHHWHFKQIPKRAPQIYQRGSRRTKCWWIYKQNMHLTTFKIVPNRKVKRNTILKTDRNADGQKIYWKNTKNIFLRKKKLFLKSFKYILKQGIKKTKRLTIPNLKNCQVEKPTITDQTSNKCKRKIH